ncbi:MAG: hypothetical protein Q9161_005342 [Pseudevernia consocians]
MSPRRWSLAQPKQYRKDHEPVKERAVRGPCETHGTVKITESYEQIRKIGAGGQGKVWIVKRKSDKKILVRKEQEKYNMRGSVPEEMYIFENVLTYHPRIIEFEHANYIKGSDCLVLYFEHCKGGDLSQIAPGGGENFLWQCFIQLADALAFLHYGHNRFARHPNTPSRTWRRVIHRDLKPANVFLRHKLTGKNPVPELVLGDFGLATLDQQSSDGSGTSEWMGPEIPYLTKQNDVWALGSIIHFLAHGRGPVPPKPKTWPGTSREWYRHPDTRLPKQLSKAYSSVLNRNMMDCLVMDPNSRVNSLQLVRNIEADGPRARR